MRVRIAVLRGLRGAGSIDIESRIRKGGLARRHAQPPGSVARDLLSAVNATF
ncbi:hypothetical protein [Burkholderia ambifaria]|uniref:hypothetical protein n=1 Tax=Burkholderia ambifaria TaxID=152480 RepID=UPI00158DC3B8|nr:hypothetical protein [Burkholderia ambifaria]